MVLLLFVAASVSAALPGPKPVGNPESWITTDDYPIDALETSGTVEFDITVDDKGRGARCLVTRGSGNVSLNTAACAAILRRGRWAPTLDNAGQPIFAIYRRRVVWVSADSRTPTTVKLPADLEVDVAKLPVPADQAVVVVRQIQQADGTLESCVVETPSPSAPLNRAACRVAAESTKNGPIANIAGQLVRGARWRTIEFVEKPAAPVSK